MGLCISSVIPLSFVIAVVTFVAYAVLYGPSDWKSNFRCLIRRVTERPNSGFLGRTRSHSERQSGWIVYGLERVLAHIGVFSLSQWLRHSSRLSAKGRAHGRDDESDLVDRRETGLIDFYVVLVTAALVVLLIAYESSNSLVSAVSVAYLLGEMVLRTVAVLVFDHLREHPTVASVQRTLLLGILNVVQVVIGFALLLRYAGYSKASITEQLYASLLITSLVDVPDRLTGAPSLVVSSQIVVSVWLFVFLIAWALSGLPRRTGGQD